MGVIEISIYNTTRGFASFELVSTLEKGKNAAPYHENKAITPLCISPALSADVSVSSLGKDRNDPALSLLAPIAAADFLINHRGLPLSSLDVEFNGKLYEVQSSGKDGKLGVSVDKCKELYSKISIFVDNTDIPTSEYLYENITVRLFECRDAASLLPETLKKLLFRKEIGGADIAVGYSRDRELLRIKFAESRSKTAFPAIISALAAASHAFLGAEGDRLSVCFESGRVDIELRERGIFLSC